MENAVEALKIAFGVMMFVLALTLSISSFSKANSTVTAIVRMNDRETEYTYVESSNDLTRTVGVETIVPAMYRAYYENFEIKFFDKDGEALTLYREINSQNGSTTDIKYIEAENIPNIQFLDELLKSATSSDSNYEFIDEYERSVQFFIR